jgi:hypothetical protein
MTLTISSNRRKFTQLSTKHAHDARCCCHSTTGIFLAHRPENAVDPLEGRRILVFAQIDV